MDDYVSFVLEPTNRIFPSALKHDESIRIEGENVVEIILDNGPGLYFTVALQDRGTISSITFDALKTRDSFFIPPFFKGFWLQLMIPAGSTSIVKGKLKTRVAKLQSEFPSDRFSIPR